eukprot:12383935-Alexandrium_andersonii.AAC.1
MPNKVSLLTSDGEGNPSQPGMELLAKLTSQKSKLEACVRCSLFAVFLNGPGGPGCLGCLLYTSPSPRD